MKRIAFVFALLATLSGYGQKDTLLHGYSIVTGVGSGPGFILGSPEYNSGYDQVFYDVHAYCDLRAEVGVLWNEKAGFRILTERQGNRGDATYFWQYVEGAYPGYHYVGEYSHFYSGYSYSSITPEFIYRIGKEPFNCTFAMGFGTGKLCPGYGFAVLQENGNNNFKVATYSAEKVWNYNATAGADIAYMRQLSPHLFMNTGIFVSYSTLYLNYSYTYTEQEYNQPVSVNETYNVRHGIGHLNSGVFLNFQWNSAESARAYYR